MQPNRVVEPGTPEWEAWCDSFKPKERAHIRKRRAYLKSIGWPWPDRGPPEVKPAPATLDWWDEEEG